MRLLEASCSHCAFSRRFSRDLAGRYYRCPKCKRGVIAVPIDSEESAVLPKAVAKPDAAKNSIGESGQVPIRIDSDDEAPKIDLSSSVFEFPEPAKPQARDTETNTALDLTGLAERVQVSDTSVERPVAKKREEAEKPGEKPNFRGQVGAIRKVLVECGLCGFHVQVPVEFFGKAIHCPNCAGNSIFTESTLDPIKDEILDRLAVETGERDAIYRGEPREPSMWRELLASSAIKSFLVGVGLGLLVLGAMWGAIQYRRVRARKRIVTQAVAEGWRYARNTGEEVFHEPWCRALDPHRPTERVTQEQFEERKLKRHDCD